MVASAVASAFGIARVTPLFLGWQILRMGMSHLAADKAPATTPVGPSLKLSAALTKCVADIAERQDQLVRCATGTGRGAPNVSYPRWPPSSSTAPTTLVRTRALATRRGPRIEIVRGAMGVLVHEATHADDGEGQRPDVRKSGAPIPTSTIHRVLRNRIYTGNFHWHGRLHEIAIGGRVA